MPGSLSEKIYYQTPEFIQNIIFSIHGYFLSRKRYNRFFHAHLERLKKSEWWAEDHIRRYQDENIRNIVNHAYNTVPFYKKFYDEHGVDVKKIVCAGDLQKLPVLTKDMVRANQDSMVSAAFRKSSLIKGLTSGTTGTPLNIYMTPEGLAYQWAVWWRHKARFGLTVKDRHLIFGARVPVSQDQKKPPYWRNDIINNRVYLSTYHISRDTLKDIVDYLNSDNFDFFTGYPSAMYTLASLMEDSGMRLYNRPKYVITGSDALIPAFKAAIGRVFGAPVSEQYGMTEFAGNVSKCECGLFHLDFECCYLETKKLDESDYSKLIFTGWGNPAMPFIRYDVGDYGKLLNSYCECGRRSLVLESIDGRLEDFVVTPDGRKLIGMNQVLEYAPNAREIQIYQETPDSIEFRIVPTEYFGEADKDALLREFRRRFGTNVTVSFRLVDQLERSSSGKLKAVISRVGSEAAPVQNRV